MTRRPACDSAEGTAQLEFKDTLCNHMAGTATALGAENCGGDSFDIGGPGAADDQTVGMAGRDGRPSCGRDPDHDLVLSVGFFFSPDRRAAGRRAHRNDPLLTYAGNRFPQVPISDSGRRPSAAPQV